MHLIMNLWTIHSWNKTSFSINQQSQHQQVDLKLNELRNDIARSIDLSSSPKMELQWTRNQTKTILTSSTTLIMATILNHLSIPNQQTSDKRIQKEDRNQRNFDPKNQKQATIPRIFTLLTWEAPQPRTLTEEQPLSF